MEPLSYEGPSIVMGAHTNAHMAHSHRPSLYHNLLNFNKFQATDPKDKAYALVRISTTRDDPRFIIDYSRSARDVYISIVQYMLSYQGSLNIICSARAGSAIPDLPSWVPDWTLTTRQTKGSIQKRLKSAEPCLPTDASISEDGKILTAQGFRVDSIRHQGKTWNLTPHSCFRSIPSFHVWREFVIDKKGAGVAHQMALIRSIVFGGAGKPDGITSEAHI